MRRWILGAAALVSGCGGGLMDEPLPATAQAEAQAPVAELEAAAQKPSPPPGALFRQDVKDTVETGLGYFLQRVSVDPELSNGKFQGFRIVELRPPSFWQGVDLKPGDVVTRVNGMTIERDIDAYQAFQALLAAPELRISFSRSGTPRELVYSIIDRDGMKPAVKAPAAAPPAPAPSPTAAPQPSPVKPSGTG